MDDKSTILLMNYTTGDIRIDSFTYTLANGFNNFLKTIKYDKERIEVINKIDWYNIYELFNNEFITLWNKITNPKFIRKLDDFAFFFEEEILQLLKNQIYFDILKIIQTEQSLKNKSAKQLNKMITKELPETLLKTFQIFYYQFSVTSLTDQELKKFIELGKKLSGKKYDKGTIKLFDEIVDKYEEEKNKGKPKKLRSIAFQVFRKQKIFDETKQINLYKSLSKYRKKYRS